jgi:paraquat-inducible protein B
MSKQANPVAIGAFVLGAIALLVLGIVVFGSGRLFADTTPFVLYFSGSVDGLSVGSPVRFKGVEIGAVTSIQLDLGDEARIPVWIEIDNRRIIDHSGQGFMRDPTRFAAEVDRGLRAQLNTQSIVTGLLFVQLDYHPDTAATFVSGPDERAHEIPTIPTTLEQAQQVAADIINKLRQVDFDAFARAVREAIEGVNRAVNAPGLQATLEALPETLGKLDKTLASVQQLAANLDERTGPLVKSLQAASDRSTVAVEQARETMKTVQKLADPGSPLAGQLGTVLEELRNTARSVRLLADYLERNPAALIRGREVKNP